MTIRFSLEQLQQIAAQLAALTGDRKVLAFRGGMGMGKTTLIGALCRHWGVKTATGSPTFSIINAYEGAGGTTIYHMDWYRLRDGEEAIAAGVEDALYSGHRCLVEWPERAESLLPDDTLFLSLELDGPDTRVLTLEG